MTIEQNAAASLPGARPVTVVGRKAADEQLALGLWDFDDKSSAFVVFDDDDGERKGMLLGGWRGRPGYSLVPLREVEECKFVATVTIQPTDYASFTSVSAMLGKLVIKDGRPLVSTVGEEGRIMYVSIAPLKTAQEGDENCHYSWELIGTVPPEQEQTLFAAHGNNSWLNFWISYEYEIDDFGCPMCGQDVGEESEDEQ